MYKISLKIGDNKWSLFLEIGTRFAARRKTSFPFNIELEILDGMAIGERNKSRMTGNEKKTNSPLLAYDMIVYIENPKEATDKLLG